MVVQPKIKILGRGKLSRIDEIKLVKIKTGAKFLCPSHRELCRFDPVSYLLSRPNKLAPSKFDQANRHVVCVLFHQR